MKSYVLLACVVVLAFVSSAKCDEAYHKYLNAIPADIQAKCAEEADLAADKDKLLADEQSVDAKKLSCFTACALKQSGALTDGKISSDVLGKQLDKLYAGDENLDKRKELTKACADEASGADDCEKVGNVASCIMKKLAENGLK